MRPSRTNTQKSCPFHLGDWNAKVGSQEIPGVTGKIWSWSTEWSRAKANRVLPREHTGHSKQLLPATQEKTLHMDSTRWSIPNQTDYILCSQRWRTSIQSAKTWPGADCGSDHELLIAKFRLTLKKVGKTTRLFMYDLNQIPYDYTVEVRNRFKGLDLTDRVPEELWTEACDTLYRRQWSRPSPRKRNAKWSSGEALQIAEKRREAKGKREKERYTHLNAEFQRTASRDKKAFLSDQCKEIEGNKRMGKTRDLFKKIRDTRGTFHASMSLIKDRNGMEADDI